MQSIHDIFGIWGTFQDVAVAIGEKPDTVYRWQRSGRIPDTAWQPLMEAAEAKGRTLTPVDFYTANRPSKQRGRPAHKAQAMRVAG